MKNDFMSVGPPQLFGDRIDRPIGLDPELKGDFENLLQKGLEKKEQKVESALGGTNRKVAEDRDGFKEKTKEAEKETKVKEPEKEKEKRKTKTIESGVEMSASNTMVSVESSLEVGSLESDFVITDPEQKLENENATEFAASAAIGVSAVNSNEELVEANALATEAASSETQAPIDEQAIESQDLMPPQQPVATDFEKSIQAQLARDQKELEQSLPVKEQTGHEAQVDSFESLSQLGQDAAPLNQLNQNVVSTTEIQQTAEMVTLQSVQNSQSEFTGNSERDTASQDQPGSDQSTADQSVVSLDQQGDARQLHVHRDSDFRTQLGTATVAQSMGKDSASLSTADRAEIVKQAQVLVNDGGGVAKIQLQSEELGSIDLHVRLSHGKVQIELGSNDPALKAAIEDSLSDLKSSLAQHNFDLDHVKIKGVSGASENFSMQSNGMQHQSDTSGSKNGFASHGGDERGHQSHRESQMRELGSMYRQSQAKIAESNGGYSDVIQPMSIGRGISRYQKTDSVAQTGRSAWVA